MYAHNVFARMHTQSIKYIHTKKLLHACTHINFLHTYIHKNHYTPRMYTKLLHESMYTTFLQAHTDKSLTAHIPKNYYTHTCTQHFCTHTHTKHWIHTHNKLWHTYMHTTVLQAYTHSIEPIFTYQKIIARIHAHDIFAHTHTHTNH